ncbi:MAG: cysteine synthase A [Ruminococcaceae bacterium]|nr:cysteine synthase A [Oscillospiraceae bacterium]
MTKIYKSAEELVGNTPLLELCAIEKAIGTDCTILAKLESFNPAGSAKDRVASAMIERAEELGLLKKGGVIIEPTSGNTGIGLARVAAIKGYKAIIVMPDTMSAERRALVTAYGGEVALSPGAEGMNGAIALAKKLAAETPNSYIPDQFNNPANPEIHYKTTAPEIWEATEGKLDIFVAGVGSGGTLGGVARFMKEKNSDIQIVAAEPAGSPLLSGGTAGSHGLQGIGANFIPAAVADRPFDRVIAVNDEDAFEYTRRLARLEGILCGISSGAALWAACKLALESSGKTIVVVLPDTGERYLSTGIF